MSHSITHARAGGRLWVVVVGLWTLAATACGGRTTADHAFDVPAVVAFPPSEGVFEGTVADDLDPAPNVVEVRLEAKQADIEITPGRRVPMWTYNGVLPGPRIEARVGDTVRVHFKNALPEATTIHWHGLRVPNAMDGVHLVQTPIESGGSFTYTFVVPDAGVFWYHPHIRSDEQVERGLYGAFIVRGPNEPVTTTDRVVVLDDVLLDADGERLADFNPMTQAMVGRQGTVILVNGRARPIDDVRPGGLHRYRFVNAANARYFRLALPGRRFTQIGGDAGLVDEARTVDDLLLVPGERADVVVTADADTVFDWKTLPYDRGHGTGSAPDADLFRMRVGGEPAQALPAITGELAVIPEPPAPEAFRELRLEESMGGGHAGHGGMSSMGPVFRINGRAFPDGSPLLAAVEGVEEWSIVNTTEMDHPFHLHGYRFQIISEGGAAPPFRAWRDTFNVRAKTTARIRVRFEANPGRWMFHCHILEHAERGMAGELRVE